MVDAGYTIIGEQAGSNFNNNWWYDIGLGHDLGRGIVNLSVFLEEYRALVPGVENAREVLAAVSLRTDSGWRVQVTGAVGLFTLGAFVASAAWQLLLVGGGSLLGRLLNGRRGQLGIAIASATIMLGLAVVVLVG